MRILLLLLATVGLATAQAQTVIVDTLFTFEGADGMGDVEGWEVTQDADSISTDNSEIKTITEKAINGQGGVIQAFEGSYLLEMTPDRPLRARTFRGGKYTWATPQDWTNRSTVKLAASMNARGADSERHQFRIRVISGTGVNADTTEKVFDGLKSEEFDSVDNNTFVNEWEVLEFDLSEDTDFDLSQITQIEAAARNIDDGTENSPTTGNPTPGPDGNWGGNVHIDLVTVEGEEPMTDVEGAPGLESLSEVYPNPSAQSASVRLAVDDAQRVVVTLHDVLGRTVATALDGPLSPGSERTVSFDTAQLSAGTYLVRVQGETFAQTRRLTVSR